MILVDTNVWIDYFRARKSTHLLSELLMENQVITHPWIFGELMLGNLGPKRDVILADLNHLPNLQVYPIEELSHFVEKEELYRKGLSLVDVQLLYASIVSDCLLWTHDTKLRSSAQRYDKAYLETFKK